VERALRRLHKHLGDEDVYNEVRVRAHFVPKGQAARCKSARARRRREK
jgi:ribosomal protein S21